MKKLIVFSSIALIGALISCDKVTNAYPKTGGTSELDWSLYPDGDSAYYVSQGLWPTFTANTNTLRNVMIEDFTGHRCQNCPASTANMESLAATDPARIYTVGIHAANNGLSAFQETSAEYPTNLYCDAGLEIGTYFGSIVGSTFIGNPAFCVNRIKANDQFTSNAGSAIANKTNACLSSTLKVNIQAETNYFASTRGLFLHTEVDVIDNSLTSELGLVVYLIEDSLVAKQLLLGTIDNNYVHRDILRGCIDNRTFGRTLDNSLLNSNGKYYANYSYVLPSQYNPDNMHLLIYVYDKVTMEIYQVIKKHL